MENSGLGTAAGVYKAMTGGRGGGERPKNNVRYESSKSFQMCVIKQIKLAKCI